MLTYLEQPYEFVNRPLWWHKQGLSQTASGYGGKLTSQRCIRIEGEKRLRRVYITQYGNAGSAWVMVNGQRVYLR